MKPARSRGFFCSKERTKPFFPGSSQQPGSLGGRKKKKKEKRDDSKSTLNTKEKRAMNFVAKRGAEIFSSQL